MPAAQRRAAAAPRQAPAGPVARWTPHHWALLALITAAGAFLRLWNLRHAPPGIEQDEALGAWMSWCLLHTGRDMSGQAWPIFYAHGIGDSPPTLSFYLTMPFQWLGGLSPVTTRLPGALAGALCVPLLAWLGNRLLGTRTALIASALLAFSPWHLFVSRFGVGASQCPIEALLPVAMLLAAGLLDDSPVRPVRAALAGVAAGVFCYGFQVMRIYFPIVFALLAWAVWSQPGGRSAKPGTARAVLAFAATFLVFFLPLAWLHLTDPEISRRGEMTRLWSAGAPFLTKAGLVLGRYVEHFSPVFLFVRADPMVFFAPQHQGEMHLYEAPLLVAGIGFAVARARHSRTARILLALLLAYPVGDVFAQHLGPHALRSSPGIPSLMLIAAYGAVESGRWLADRSRPWFRVAAAAFALAFIGFNARYLPWYFVTWDRLPEVQQTYHADLVEAFEWIRPQISKWDAVYVTTIGTNQPQSVALVTLRWDPERWFQEPRATGRSVEGWELTARFGPIRFLYQQVWRPELDAMNSDNREQHVLFVLRPGELGLEHPTRVISRPDGSPALWLFDVTM